MDQQETIARIGDLRSLTKIAKAAYDRGRGGFIRSCEMSKEDPTPHLAHYRGLMSAADDLRDHILTSVIKTNIAKSMMVQIMRRYIKCDAIGLSPALASVYLTGFEEAAEAVLAEGLSGWRSIDSAPRDGTAILAYEGGVLIDGTLSHWIDVVEFHEPRKGYPGWHSVGGERSPPSCHPTHWQPLPIPPEHV